MTTSPSEKLKPCPFCGSSRTCSGETTNDDGDHDAWCCDCGAILSAETEAEAIAKWNHRPIEDRLRTHMRNVATALDNKMPAAIAVTSLLAEEAK